MPVCNDCSAEAKPGRTLCVAHLQSANEHRKQREAKRKIAGLCSKCPERADLGFTSCGSCRKKYATAILKRNRALKVEVFSAYGGVRCACCSVAFLSMLTIDHINGGGNKHRESILNSRGGTSFYRWLKKNGYPSGYQVLCWNCNLSKRYGPCEHLGTSENG